MTPLTSTAYIRYLAAKKQVDDRALNRYVWQCLKESLPDTALRRPLRIMELGAGIGTMLWRVLEWGLVAHMHYLMVEKNPDLAAACRLPGGPAQGGGSGRSARRQRVLPGVRPCGQNGCTMQVVCADLYDVVEDPRHHRQWDLIIAHAVMDLVDPQAVLRGLARMVPGALLYLSLNYDGWTVFLPGADAVFERRMLARYHLSMDRRTANGRPSGSSRTGRELFVRLAELGMPVLAAGSSDWIVHPRDGRYRDGETVFLETIIETIVGQMRQDAEVDPAQLTAWAELRRDQADAGRLIFMARNMDFLARVPDE